MRLILPALVFSSLLAVATAGAAAHVDFIKVDGPIGPATAGYIDRALHQAKADGAECLVIQLDTPGGLLESTKVIVQAFLASPVPVAVYVAPAGATATSAGCFIALAADIAAMAPTTSIGAAHPVEIGFNPVGGGEKTDDTMKTKLENYAVSYIETIADRRHRNVDWAKSAVRDSASITADHALELKVIDLIAPDLRELLARIDGRVVGGRTLQTRGVAVVDIAMTVGERVFQRLWRPEVMFILMLIAIYGIIGELSTPGAILPGVLGAIALILVLYMAAILPINLAGLALIALAVGLFVADVYAPTHGVLTAGGAGAFFLGALMLFDRTNPAFRLSLSLIVPATVVTALFFVVVVGAGLRAQLLPVRTGREAMLGRVVVASARIDASGGWLFLDGERWSATSDTAVEPDQLVEIVGLEGLTLKVKPAHP
ncbi:MAG TPA: nodulation protein NfeD [Lacunisphaera sp.]|nr:nodulation protein NfeD [Lacunisphaera sp.]